MKIERALFGWLISAAFVCGISVVTVDEAHAQPASNTTKVRYTPAKGKFEFNGNFGKKIKKQCRLIVKASIGYEGDTEPTAVKRLLDYRFTRQDRVKLVVNGIPGASNNEDGEPPYITVQSRLTCKNSDIDITSNVDARYVNCGEGQQELIPIRFLEELNEGLRSAADAQASDS